MSKRKRSYNVSGFKKAFGKKSRYTKVKKKKPQFTKAQERSLKDILKEAKKWADVHKSDVTLQTEMSMIVSDDPGGQGGFFAIAQTDAEDNNRNGDTIRGVSVDIRGTLKTAFEGTTCVRIMAIQYSNRSTADIAKVLVNKEATAGTGESSAVVDSFRVMNGDIKYNVLWDKKITIPAGEIPASDFKTKAWRMYLKLTPSQSKMTYDYTTATTPKLNPIYVYACYADVTGDSNDAPKLQYHGRLRYVDV